MDYDHNDNKKAGKSGVTSVFVCVFPCQRKW